MRNSIFVIFQFSNNKTGTFPSPKDMIIKIKNYQLVKSFRISPKLGESQQVKILTHWESFNILFAAGKAFGKTVWDLEFKWQISVSVFA